VELLKVYAHFITGFW